MDANVCIILQVPACPNDYTGWLVSMFSLFGTKFVKLFSGPMWRVEATSQDSTQTQKEKLTVNVMGFATVIRIPQFHML